MLLVTNIGLYILSSSFLPPLSELPAVAGLHECCGVHETTMALGADQCIGGHDPMVVGAHRDAAAILFPYTERFEDKSWWV